MRCHCHKARHDRLLEKGQRPFTSTRARQRSQRPVLTLHSSDPALRTFAAHISDPSSNLISASDLAASSELCILHSIKHMLHLHDGILTYVPEPHTAPQLVVPHGQRETMLVHAHDAPCAGHHGAKATYEALKQVAYWPDMQQDVAEYVKGCLVCCQFQPASPNCRAPLQQKGMSFPWSDLQIDWVGPGLFANKPHRHDVLPLHLPYQPGDMNLVTAYTTHQYLEELHQHLRMTFSFAQQQLQKSAEGRKAYYNQRPPTKNSHKVWYYSFPQTRQNAPHRLSKKFLPHWTGPHEIVDKLSHVVYRIRIRQGHSEPVLRWAQQSQIKRHLGSNRQKKGEDHTR
ncbi:Transposon Ty3-G Gag-Pol [Labeo rohita]|uniref:Transposon Ty3-G Gag-Pol n=2 Tax=Labeo rohita TaxID=84645 RepID=A0A498LZN0_LABRO|nr:Protein NYNRIN [Labeo rohita]RXN10855.1 Transposon Ty3-G Gag-Pol [Labeo rohita]